MLLRTVQKIGLCALACVGLITANISHADVPINRVAAVVNDQIILQSDLNNLTNTLSAQAKANGTSVSSSTLHKDALNQLIDQTLLLQAAKNANIKVNDQQLTDTLTQIADEHHITYAQLPTAVAQQGLPFDHFKKQISDQLVIQQFLQQALAGTFIITPKEVDKLAKKLGSAPKVAPSKQILYHFRVILIPLSANATPTEFTAAKQKFEAIAQSINQHEDFGAISQRILGTPPQDLGWRSTEQLPATLVKLLPKLQTGQIAPPIRAPNGINILQLTETKTVDTASTDNNPTSNNTVQEVKVRDIFLKSDNLTPKPLLERRLTDIKNQLDHGANFAILAEQDSQDTTTAPSGGEMGWLKPGMLDPKLEEAIAALKINQISEPIETPAGWYIFQVLERKTTTDPEAALKLRAQQILFQQKMQEGTKVLIDELKSQAYIKIFNEK